MGIGGTHDSSERFRRSLWSAQMKDLLGLIRGKNTDLVSYEEVARRVKAYQQVEMGTRMVPLDQIVGSVGRYRDFTREFLPRTSINKERWQRVDGVLHSQEGYPPVELYKIGEVYFVRDGNHRVSVARANGLTHIEAFVTQVQTDVPLTQDDFARDAWLVKTERTEFLEKTRLDTLRPGNGVELTEPGRYQILLRHIFVHQYLRNMDLDSEGATWRLDWEGAVASWYDNVYVPVVEAIREFGLLDQFPGRTEADAYLWITYHREDLASLYGLAPLTPEQAVSTFAQVHDDRLLQKAYKGAKYIFLRATGTLDKPLGLTEEEFADARARHEAGERTLMEVEDDQAAAAEEAAAQEAAAQVAAAQEADPEPVMGVGAEASDSEQTGPEEVDEANADVDWDDAEALGPYDITEPAIEIQQRSSLYLTAQ